jgi:TP901 family phage tail tape measure protein
MAAESVELATAYLNLVPSMRGAASTIGGELSGAAVQGAVGRAGDKAGKTFSSRMSTAGKIGTAVLTAPILAIGAAGLKAALDVDDAYDTIRAGTGATGKKLEGLQNTFNNVARKTPADMDKVSSTVADLNTRLGLTGPTLEKLSRQILEAGRLGGVDVDVQKVTGAFSVFGVKGKETTTKMDDLFRVSQATGVGINDLAGTMAKSGGVLKQLGFGFTESASLLGVLDKAGINSKAVTASMQAGLVKLAKDGEKPADAFKRVTGQLQGFVKQGDDAKALKLAGEIFGTRGAGQFVAALKSGKVNLDDLTGAAGLSKDTILGVAQETKDFPELWQEFKNTATLALAPIGQKLMPAIAQALQVAAPLLQKFANWFGGLSGKQMKILLGIGGALALIGPALWAASKAQQAWTVATQVWSAVTKVATLVQKGLNLAMRANPIGLVITAVGLLVAALVWFFTKTKVGQKIVKAAWSAIKSAISGVASWWTKTAWPAIRKAIDAMGRWFRDVGRAIGRVWNAIRSAIGSAWTWIKRQVFDRIRAGIAAVRLSFRIAQLGIAIIWAALRNGLRAGWDWINTRVLAPFKRGLSILGTAVRTTKDNIIRFWRAVFNGLQAVGRWIADRVFTPLRRGLGRIGDAFRAVPGIVRNAWARIKGAAAKPINFVINTIYNNGIKKLWDSFAGKFGIKIKLPKISPIKGYDTGGWTGPGSRLTPAGLVHADEFVVKKSSRGRMERRFPGLLDHINRAGTLAGYAGGGLVDAAKWWISKGARASEHPLFGGVHAGHMKGSLHYTGNAVDLNYGPGGQNAIETSFFNRLMPMFKSMFPKIATIWQAPGHYDHAHIDTGGISMGSSGGGGGLDFLGLASKFSALRSKLSELGESPFGRIAVAMGKKLISGPVDFLKDKASQLVEGAADSVGSALGGVKIEAARAQVRAAAASLGHPGWAFGGQWDALNKLIMKESSWNTAAKNPTSSAAGLFQKMTSIHGPVESTAFGQARWGLKYIADRYGDPAKAWAFHQGHGWYANGGRVGLYDQGGWIPNNGMGINLSGRPEAVLDPDESRALKAGLNSGPLVHTMITADPREAIARLERMQRRAQVRAGLRG